MLKSLELFGFKSFADRTKFEFSSGITAVVGPNGSGKSNVVDGLKWILGDQSPKSLRGKEMTDVIFNGTRNRKAGAMAEASLVFDNSSGFLPIESQEVHVGRRLWRSGDSEYLLNNTPVRLKDVRQLLMGTGAGSAAYSIIEQGRVDQILQANAISRRGIFEESAGISLYRSRRSEFVRRMERVDQSLTRLTDIVDEVESQRNALRTQAERAAIYRELSAELRTRWLGLAADDYRLLESKAAEATAHIAEQQSQLEQANAERESVESRLEKVDHELSEIDRRLREKDREVASLREVIAGHHSTIRQQSGRMAELEADFLRLKRQRALLEDRVRDGTQERERLERDLQAVEQSCNELEVAVAEHQKEVHSLEEQLQAGRNAVGKQQVELDEANQRQTELQSQLQSLQTRLHSTRSAGDVEQRRLADLRERLDDERQLADDAAARFTQAEQSLHESQQCRKDADEYRRSLLDELSAFQSSLADLREERSGCHARITVLEDLESRQEGLGIGVREILRRAKTSDYPPWNQIAGTVSDLIDVELEHAALLEAALGDRAQWIVIGDFDPLVEYLLAHSAQISGRVRFVEFAPPADERNGGSRQLVFRFLDADPVLLCPSKPEAQAKGTPPGPSLALQASIPRNRVDRDFTGRSGVVRRADEFATARREFAALPAQILSDTWIVESLEIAFRLADEAAGRCRFVTLQGEMLAADGTLTVGTPRSESAVVSRKSELRQLKNELLRLDHRIGTEERRLAETNEQLADADRELQSADEEVRIAAGKHSDRKSELAARRREFARLQAEAESVEAEIARLNAVAKELAADQAERQSLLDGIQRDVQSLQDAIAAAETQLAGQNNRLQDARQRRDSDQLQLATQHERRQSLQDAFARAGREQDSRVQQRDEAVRRCDATRTKRRDTELAVLRTRGSLAELSLTLERGLADAEEIVACKDDIRGRRMELTRQETALRKQCNHLQTAIHTEDMAVRESRQRQETLAERIREEYQTELAEAVEAGVSAFAEYLAQQTVGRIANPSEEENDNAEGGGWKAEGGNPHSPLTTTFEDVRPEFEAQVERLRRKLKAMGSVNADSLRDLDEIEARYEHLSTTLGDLVEAKKHLEDLVRRIDQKCRQLFRETFDAIRENFRELFRKAFGGGDGDIVLEDPDDVLECGIDIVARPPGKELKSISLLSGGEKTLTAFALLLAMFKHRPSPYCILDEVDAALDEANVERLRALLTEFRESTQFVMITHKKPTMTIADLLYGVTMEESGVSKRMTVKFDNIGENGEFLTDDAKTAAA
jgi:chromosome segregation protein